MTRDNLTIVERKLREQHSRPRPKRRLPSINPIQMTKNQRAQRMFNNMVILINQEVNLPEFKQTYFPDEDRTLEWNIKGMEDVDSGFVFEDSKVRTIKKLRDKPTCRFFCNEDTFLLLSTGELTYPQAYFWDLLQIDGENALRDYEIFKRMFNKYGHLLKGIRGV